jgi:hypothetical protein
MVGSLSCRRSALAWKPQWPSPATQWLPPGTPKRSCAGDTRTGLALRSPRTSCLDLDHHPRVQIARSLRSRVEVYADERGLITLADGIAGRREVSIEAGEESRGRGRGRALLGELLGIVPTGEPVFAAVSPGNARSLRAFLAAGFVPVGSEVILRPR